MGEIVIKIPNNMKRRYLVTDSARADALIDVLDHSAVRLKNDFDPDSPSRIEDMRDGESALRNLNEMRTTGISHTVDELRKEFGIS